jgi:hypothetical protein
LFLLFFVNDTLVHVIIPEAFTTEVLETIARSENTSIGFVCGSLWLW